MNTPDAIFMLKQAAQFQMAANVQMDYAEESRLKAAKLLHQAWDLYPTLSLSEQNDFDKTLATLKEEYGFHE